MWRSVLVGVLASVVVSSPVLAQAGSITGTVTSAEGARPLAGVQVHVVGTSLGAVTRDAGQFSITVQPGTYTVRATLIGFAPDSVMNVVVAPGSVATADFRLTPVATILEGVVSVGYGEQEARDRTGVVETVTTTEFNTGRIVTAEELIQAKVPGVQVVDNGEPGGGISLRIRGGSSVTSSNEPLFVIDGIPLAVGVGINAGRNPLAFLNPADIESITVLKDASATAIYGSRGANGVLLITTKSGAQGAQLSYSGSLSGSTVTRDPGLLNAEQFRAAVATWAPENLALLGSANTNWREAVQRSGRGQEHSLAFSLNRDAMQYRLSLGYLDQDGVVQGSAVRRLSAALNYSHQLFDDRLHLRTTLHGARTDDWFTPGSVIGAATAFAPTQPIRSESGDFFQWSAALAPDNPLAELALVSDRSTSYRSIGKVEGEIRLPALEALSTTVRLAYDVRKGERTSFFPSTLRSQIENSLGGTLNRHSPTALNTVFDLFGNYGWRMEEMESDIELTAGYSYEQSRGDSAYFLAQGLSSDLLGPNGVPAAELQRTFINVDESKLASFFGRVNYTLRDRYLLTLSVRRDGSSKFGPGNQWGTFPSVAFAWRIIDEPFMRSMPALSDLKLRLSWGVNGNQAFANYQAFSSYVIGGSQAQVQFGDEFVTTIRPSAVDPDIKWEQTASYNVGLDYGILDNRVSGSLEYYRKKTTDLIFTVPVAAGTNLSNFVTTNIGSLENEGFELGIDAAVLDGSRGGITWTASFNASTNRNELTRINAIGAGNEQILTGGIAGGVGSLIQVLQPGHPINSFFVYRHRRGPDGRPLHEDRTGDGTITDLDLYEDLDGDGAITQSDRAPYKNPAPKWILGHTSRFTLGRADFGFTMRAYLGNYVYNNVASNLGHYSALRGSAPVNLHASVLTNEFDRPQYFSDVYVEDGSFIRMDNVTLGYTFRDLRPVGQLRLFAALQNAFTITDYTGIDPMAGINGIDNNLYPRSRTFSAGINVGF